MYYPPSVKVFDHGLDPKFREEGQIVFARRATKCIKSETYLQGLYMPRVRTALNALLTDLRYRSQLFAEEGIQYGDTNPATPTWDDRRKTGVLNDFDLARFADQAGASGQDGMGTLPFMALDLLSKEGICGKIPRRYRHEAESFAWCLIYLCLSMAEDTDGKIYTRDPHPLPELFRSWKTSRDFKFALFWCEYDNPDVPLVHPNTEPLARALHEYWSDRYTKQLRGGRMVRMSEGSSRFRQTTGLETPLLIKTPPYKEPEDEYQFRELVATQARELPSATKEVVLGMVRAYLNLDWSA